MDFIYEYTMLALSPPPAQPGTQANPTGEMVKMFGMLALMGVMFYFVLIRPQQKKAREHTKLLATVAPGDRVMTSGGIVGIVLTVKDKTVTVRSADAKLEIAKSAIAEITERGVKSAAE